MKRLINISAAMLVFFIFSGFSTTDISLEPYKYSENFETNELSAWASYPFWQDTAFDPNMRVGTMVPGDPNLSVVQKVIPYTSVDYYGGAQKKLDAYLVPGSKVKLRYYLKTQLDPEFLKIRLAAGEDGTVDFTVKNPEINKWAWVEVDYEAFVKENPGLTGNKIKVNALAVLAKFPNADPAMNIYFGIDDVELKGVKKVDFNFTTPKMEKLSEWKPFIPQKHFTSGETFSLKGEWNVGADKVTLKVTSFTDRNKILLNKVLDTNSGEWNTEFELAFPEGLYLATLEAYKGNEKINDTQFTIFVKPNSLKGVHPRLWFDKESKERVVSRLNSDRFRSVKESISSKAKELREKNPVEKMVFDVDQYPGADIDPVYGLSNLGGWGKQISAWRYGVYRNALAYNLLGDKEAGEYAKNLMVKISGFSYWLHPWWKERGQHIYYPIGELGMYIALGYDFVYDLMNEQEREAVRNALRKQIVEECHEGYVKDDLVTCNSSNWVAHITGGSLLCQAAMYDDEDTFQAEPYFTGVILKSYDMIDKSIGKDGSYGEGYGYYNFTMLSLSKTVPAMENVFGIDMSAKVNGAYKELIWAGNIEDKETYYFGDSSGKLRPLTNYAWLLPKYKDPLLGWFYNYMKGDETFMDVLYETKNVPMKAPFDQNPVKFFSEVGTTVFKSGWEKDDFIFVMRTGAFYNHQHLDQGSFHLSDRGSHFIDERHGSTYYLDPYYNSWYTQPVAHSTILLDNNQNGQRVGDPLVFAEGFNDHAIMYHYLDGSDAAFSSGNIEKVYWGKAKEMRRNVLYLKPRTVIMVDVIIPNEKDVDVSLLYQTHYFEDINADQSKSTITKDGNVLHIAHLYPENTESKVVETPHYIYHFQSEKPLEREGMLTVNASTEGKPLVMANLLTSTKDGAPDISYEENDGYVSGEVDGKDFIFSTKPNDFYTGDDFTTDALTLTWDGDYVFAATLTSLKKEGELLISSEVPFTCEISSQSIKYFHCEDADVIIGTDGKPDSVLLNGNEVNDWEYNKNEESIKINLPKGDGTLIIN